MREMAFGETKKSLLDKIIEKVRLKRVNKLVGNAKSLVDLGCGYRAELLHTLLPMLDHGVGIDLSVETSKDRKLRLLKSRVDSKLPIDSNQYDLVTALAIIEHVDHPAIMLAESYRVLKKGGKLIITTPSMLGKWPLEILAILGFISKEEIADHKRYYTKNSLERAIKEAGFREVTVSHFGILWLNLFAKATKE